LTEKIMSCLVATGEAARGGHLYFSCFLGAFQMSIRTQLLISYLVLISLLSLGMWAVDDRILSNLRENNLAFAEEGAVGITTANYRLAQEILTTYGQYIVEDKAADVATELSYDLGGKKTYNYEDLRRNKLLRKIAVQEIRTPEGVAGYTIVFDKNKVNLFHPDPKVEGINYALWRERYPEMWQLLNRSLKEQKVTGYLTFFDKDNKERQRYSATMQVPGTPFIVAAVVNIDEFFLPTHEKIRKASLEIIAKAKGAIETHAGKMDRTAKINGLLAGALFALLAVGFGFYFAASISRPLRRLQKGVKEVGEGNFAVAVPEKGSGRWCTWPTPSTNWGSSSQITSPSGILSGTPSAATSPRKW
jgi:HAMP domain-containing protein